MVNRIEEKIKEMIAEVVEISVTEIRNNAQFTRDLGADSLDYIEMLLRLEKEFQIRIPDTAAVQIKTVQHLVDFIRARTTY